MTTTATGRLAGRACIITGAASGIGRATAELFASEGARVLAVDRPGTDLSFTGDIQGLGIDITGDDAPKTIIDTALSAFGKIDVVYNNAGVSGSAPASETTDEMFDRVLAVNLRAAFRITRQAVPHLIASPYGRIIATASIMAKFSDYGLVAYSASKAGVVGMINNFALELGRHGVTANAILPGAIATGMTAASFQDEKIRAVWAKKAALRRLGQPIDMARSVLLLASDEADFITGHGLVADGGLTLRT